MTTRATYLKVGAAAAILGALAAGAISFTMPSRYTSTAVTRVSPNLQIGIEDANRLQSMQQKILSRASLTEMIQRPGMDLYRQERAIGPMEDVIENMRSRDLQIQAVPARILAHLL